MEYKELTKEEVGNILFHLEEVDRGSFGVVKKVNSNTCIKIYYKDIFNTYAKKDINELDDEIDILISVYKASGVDVNVQEIRENERKKLEYLYKIGLLKRILTYKGYMIGIEMQYYRDYLSLKEARYFLNKEDYQQILDRIRKKLDEFMANNIFPQDLSRNNILINIKTLDIIFVDLDDCYTRYENSDYLDKKPLVKKALIDRCNTKYHEIEKSINK